jgi:hypothetical protein
MSARIPDVRVRLGLNDGFVYTVDLGVELALRIDSLDLSSLVACELDGERSIDRGIRCRPCLANTL